ncbi:hypothetical protein MLD38_010556 [Melastoma candidum]|uniref:Uncharacterized protein n=1 Tax=Melastoma candidum TaxID=119954 RepID=A0ACB9R213_9MYRT|nr:hypothetical protein MLD38_010556 [Melastoma candidum]
MAVSCFPAFRICKVKSKGSTSSGPSSSKNLRSPSESESNMERKRFDSLESWSMILESENMEAWEASRDDDREEWTADLSQLFIGNKFASGAHSRIYRGIYKQRAVAVKMVRIPNHKEETRALLEQQFKSEVALLSRLLHPNIVQFIAACKKPPVYCIITEYMSQGNLRMYLNKKEPYSLSVETILSFGIVLWELTTALLPFQGMTPVQAAFAVAEKNIRPPLRESCQPALGHLIKQCWAANPSKRPDFSDIVSTLEKYDECVKEGLPLTHHSTLVSSNVILERLKRFVSSSSSIPVQA